MTEIITNIKEYLLIINPSISEVGTELIDFVIDEVLDRIQLYLNTNNIPPKLERILANIINTNLVKAQNNIRNDGNVEQTIVSISDNGQSISYSNEIKNYFVCTSDNELFSGFTTLLNRYRRVKVVNTEHND